MTTNRKDTGRESGEDALDGRDLLVGRPEGAEGRSPAAHAKTAPKPSAPPPATSPQPAEHDDARDNAMQEILETVRATAAHIDALQDTSAPTDEMAETLARETAALNKAVGDARGALARATELAAGRDGAAEAARSLAGTVAELKAQGEALDKSLHETGRLAEATARQAKENDWQSEVTAQGIAEMDRTARLLESSLRVHVGNMTRFDNAQRLRFWLTVLAMAAASFGFFTLGTLL